MNLLKIQETIPSDSIRDDAVHKYFFPRKICCGGHYAI